MALDEVVSETNPKTNRRNFLSHAAAAACGLALLTFGGAINNMADSEEPPAQNNPPASNPTTPEYMSINKEGVLVKGIDKDNPDNIYLVLEIAGINGSRYQTMQLLENGEVRQLNDEKKQESLDLYGAKLYGLLNSQKGSPFYKVGEIEVMDRKISRVSQADIQSHLKKDAKIKEERLVRTGNNYINGKGILVKGLDPRPTHRNLVYMIMTGGEPKHVEAVAVLPSGDFRSEPDEFMQIALNKIAVDYLNKNKIDYNLKPEKPSYEYLMNYFSPPRTIPGK
jgi:hypothetical protein